MPMDKWEVKKLSDRVVTSTLDRSIRAKRELQSFRKVREMRLRGRKLTLSGTELSPAVSIANSRILFKTGILSQLNSIFGWNGELRLEFFAIEAPSDFFQEVQWRTLHRL